MKNQPEIHTLNDFLTEFNEENDRGAALVAAAMLDQRLKEIIAAFMVQSKASDELLSGFNAPLGTFAARTSAAYALGLIQDAEFREINVIRKIRNEFSHDWKQIPFENGIVANLCAQLPWRGPTEHESGANKRSRFNFAVSLLLVDLMWRVRLVEAERRASKDWPNKTR